ncbi:LIC_13076 family protein [Leptospira fletcheri]|nr:hypothetical protein [Leptospira fletcheri]
MERGTSRKVAALWMICSVGLQVACSFEKRLEFSQPEKIALESDAQPCSPLGQFNRWYAFYGLWQLSSEPALPKQEGKVYVLESYAEWPQVSLSLVLGFLSSVSVRKVKITECDTTTRFIHKKDYDSFFESERERARTDFFAESERTFEDSLRKYLDKSSPADSAGKNYSTIIYRTGRIQEARVLSQDVDNIQVEWDEGEQKKESVIPKKEIYKVIFATKVIRVKEKPGSN